MAKLNSAGWSFVGDYGGYFVEDENSTTIAVFESLGDADAYVDLRQRAEAAEAKLSAVPIAAIEAAYVRHCANDLYDDSMPMCAVGPWWEIVSWLRSRR